MSAATATTRFHASSQRNSDTKKYCGVCHKKGLPESVYTSHFTKSVPGDKGIVVCPTILSAVCKFCGEKGHWADIKFCAAMRSDAKNRRRGTVETMTDADGFSRRVVRVPVAAPAAAPAPVAAPVTVYSCLSEEEVVAPVVAPRVPAVVKPVVAALPTPGISWAAMASRPVVIPVEPEEKPLAEGFVVLGRRSGAVSFADSEMTVRERHELASSIMTDRIDNIDWESEDAAIFGYDEGDYDEGDYYEGDYDENW